jgi:hypothetical protein
VHAMLALLLGGFVAVPLSLHLSDEHASHIVAEANLTAVFVSPEIHSRFARIVAELPDGNTCHVLNVLEGPAEIVSEWAEKCIAVVAASALDAAAAATAETNATAITTTTGTGSVASSGMVVSGEGVKSGCEEEVPAATNIFGVSYYTGVTASKAVHGTMHLQVTSPPQEVSRIRQQVISRETFSSVPGVALTGAVMEAWGRWQYCGSIEEVHLIWTKVGKHAPPPAVCA